MLNIKQRQMNLKFLGYYDGKIDGIEGNGTISAYEQFQEAYGLTVDGIYGEKTNAKLIEVIKVEQARLGVAQDGVAGTITTNARDNQAVSWDSIKYFKQSEFACKCGCGFDSINLNLVKILDEIREYFGQPMTITSGCRCAKHNATLSGSVSNSRHISGKAADIQVKDTDKSKVLAKCKEYVKNGRARYTYTNNTNMGNSVHIDIL
jgi:hypothetical protein